jgi:hypothetical protein
VKDFLDVVNNSKTVETAIQNASVWNGPLKDYSKLQDAINNFRDSVGKMLPYHQRQRSADFQRGRSARTRRLSQTASQKRLQQLKVHLIRVNRIGSWYHPPRDKELSA